MKVKVKAWKMQVTLGVHRGQGSPPKIPWPGLSLTHRHVHATRGGAKPLLGSCIVPRLGLIPQP